MVTAAALWLLRIAADRWPATIRDELLKEWTAEVHTIGRSQDLSAFGRNRMMLRFGVSLALARPGGGGPAFGWKRATGLVATIAAYLLGLTMLQRGWYWVYQSMGSYERWVIDDPRLPARLAQGGVALLPVVLAVGAGWWLGRRFAPNTARAGSVGLCLIAVVAAWVGAGFIAFHLNVGELASPVPIPPTMSYSFGNQPYGMVTSWATWLAAFVLLAPAVRWAAARRRRIWRVVAATGIVGVITWLAVIAGTFVQFDSSTAPRTEVWKWFPQWFVPPDPFVSAADEGAASFHGARLIPFFVSSYPHVLLAIAAFGVAFLLANRRQPALEANGFGIDSSSSRV